MKNCPEITVHWYVLCHNEMDKLPFIVKYWENVADKVIVYDNESTDGSIEYLKQFPFVEVRTFKTENTMQEYVQLDLKNNIWKESRGKADFVIVSDMDEVVWADDLVGNLKKAKENGITILEYPLVSVISDKELSVDDFVHKQDVGFFKDREMGRGKVNLFSPNDIQEMRYVPGAHFCSPIGNVKCSRITDGSICTFHLDPLTLDIYTKKIVKNFKRRSQIDKQFGFGTHYTDNIDVIRNRFANYLRNSCKNYKEMIRIWDNIVGV